MAESRPTSDISHVFVGRVLKGMARGESLQESAENLSIAVSTVKNVRERIYQKFDVNSSGEMVREGILRGILNRNHFELK